MDVRLARLDELPQCQAVRHEVFVVGQGVPKAIEVDGRDGACVHAIARDGDRVVGTARLRQADGKAKAERVAVLAAMRGRGIGVRLMDVLEAEAARMGHAELVLHAQQAVVPFYERLGYEACGAPFVEADIPHLPMRKAL